MPPGAVTSSPFSLERGTDTHGAPCIGLGLASRAQKGPNTSSSGADFARRTPTRRPVAKALFSWPRRSAQRRSSRVTLITQQGLRYQYSFHVPVVMDICSGDMGKWSYARNHTSTNVFAKWQVLEL